MQETGFEFLRGATPYVRQFRLKTFVVKVGGDLLMDPAQRRHLCAQLALLHQLSIRLVVVHGGGPQLDELCERLGIPIEKVAGRRVTSPAVLDAAKMVFSGGMHMDLLADLRQAGVPCVGLSGVDGHLTEARRRPPLMLRPDGESEERSVDFGLVGDIDTVDPRLLEHLVAGEFVPVVASLSGSDAGDVFNINADTMAAALAVALKAEKLFFLLKAPGVLADADDPTSLLSYLDTAELAQLETEGRLLAGMRPKARATRDALQQGVHSVHLISGVKPDALLTEIFTNQGSGTMVVAQREPAPGA